MNPSSVSAYVDTNCFIHLRDLKDVPWRELFPGIKHIEIVVAPIVVDELDRFKVDRDDRRRDRSRAALNLIEQASRESGFRLLLRKTPMQVSLRVAAGGQIDWGKYPDLDPTRADDQLVACALFDPETTALVSFDTGPLIRARVAGLSAHKSPENWHLPLQPDAMTEETAKLRRELATTKATKPTVTAEFIGVGKDERLDLIIPRLKPLPEAAQRRLSDILIDLNPRAQLRVTQPLTPSLLNPRMGGGVSQQQAAKYEDQYEAFRSEGRAFFKTLHERMQLALSVGMVEFELSNVSQITAHNLLVKFFGPEDAALIEDEDALRMWGGSADPPSPPKAPENRDANLDIFSLVHRPPPPREKTGFYWLKRSNGGNYASSECDEFRPTERRTETFWFRPENQGAYEGEARLEVSATNLALPVRKTLHIRLKPEDADWDHPDVQARLPRWIADQLSEIL